MLKAVRGKYQKQTYIIKSMNTFTHGRRYSENKDHKYKTIQNICTHLWGTFLAHSSTMNNRNVDVLGW